MMASTDSTKRSVCASGLSFLGDEQHAHGHEGQQPEQGIVTDLSKQGIHGEPRSGLFAFSICSARRTSVKQGFLFRGRVADVRCGSISSLPRCRLRVRFTPTNRHRQLDRRGRKSATTGLMHCSKLSGISTSYAARSTRLSISPRSVPKSIGLVRSASAPFSSARRLVSASP